jgi:hypothetical protein
VADDFGDLEEGAVGIGGVLENFFEGEAGLNDILAEDVVDGEGVSHGLDAGDVDFGDLCDVVEDGFELAGEFFEAFFVEGEAGELGDVADLVQGDLLVGHEGRVTPRGEKTNATAEAQRRPPRRVNSDRRREDNSYLEKKISIFRISASKFTRVHFYAAGILRCLGLRTRPPRMALVETLMRTIWPLMTARMRWMLGLNFREEMPVILVPTPPRYLALPRWVTLWP